MFSLVRSYLREWKKSSSKKMQPLKKRLRSSENPRSSSPNDSTGSNETGYTSSSPPPFPVRTFFDRSIHSKTIWDLICYLNSSGEIVQRRWSNCFFWWRSRPSGFWRGRILRYIRRVFGRRRWQRWRIRSRGARHKRRAFRLLGIRTSKWARSSAWTRWAWRRWRRDRAWWWRTREAH